MPKYVIEDLADYILLACIFLILLTWCIWFYFFKRPGMETEYGSQEVIEMESMSILHNPHGNDSKILKRKILNFLESAGN